MSELWDTLFGDCDGFWEHTLRVGIFIALLGAGFVVSLLSGFLDF